MPVSVVATSLLLTVVAPVVIFVWLGSPQERSEEVRASPEPRRSVFRIEMPFVGAVLLNLAFVAVGTYATDDVLLNALDLLSVLPMLALTVYEERMDCFDGGDGDAGGGDGGEPDEPDEPDGPIDWGAFDRQRVGWSRPPDRQLR